MPRMGITAQTATSSRNRLRRSQEPDGQQGAVMRASFPLTRSILSRLRLHLHEQQGSVVRRRPAGGEVVYGAQGGVDELLCGHAFALAEDVVETVGPEENGVVAARLSDTVGV